MSFAANLLWCGRAMGSASRQERDKASRTEGDIEARRLYARVTEKLFGGPSAPVRIGRYRVLERRGQGAMGVVYAAVDESLGRKVAIKLLHPSFAGDPTGRARLLREAQAMARLRHENVALVYDVGVHGDGDEQVFIAMELVDGVDLGAWLHRLPAGSRRWQDVLAVFLQAGRALAAAHRAGVLHRDFKPENVLVDAGGRARVLDFGLARALAPPAAGDPEDGLSEPLTRTGSILGTPAYMAPEQLRGADVDARADQFSFCVALYEALYGARPHAGVGRFEPLRVTHVPKDSRVPAAVRRALLRGLGEAPAGRFPDMDALLAALNPRVASRGRWFAGLLLAAGVGVGAVLGSLRPGAAPRFDFDRARQEATAAALGRQRQAAAADVQRRARAGRRAGRFHDVLAHDPTAAALLLRELPPDLPHDEDLAAMRRRVLAEPLTRFIAPVAGLRALAFDAGGALVIAADDGTRRLDLDGRPRPDAGPSSAGALTSAVTPSSAVAPNTWPSPDGRRALRLDEHGRLFLGRTWLRGHDGEIGAVAWSPDGERVAVGGGAQIRVWDSHGGPRGALTGHEGTVRALAWSPGGDRLLSGGDDEQARVFHLASPHGGQHLRGHTGPVTALAWHPGGEHVATAGRDGSVRLWTLVPAASARLDHPAAVTALAWHPDGARLATASDDGTLRLFDREDLGAPRILNHGRTALSLAWSPDGQRLASAGGDRVRVWSAAGELLRDLAVGRRGEDVLAVAWSPGGDLLAAGNDERVLLWSRGEGDARHVSGPRSPLLRLVFRPGGAELATTSVGGAARRWRLDLSEETPALREAGRLAGEVNRLAGEVNDVAWCPDGLLALAREDHRVDLRAADGAVMLERNTGVAAQSVVCEPDGAQLVAGLADGRIRRWSRRGGPPPADLRGHAAEVDALAFDPTGATLASGDRRGRVYLWPWSDEAIARALADVTRVCLSVEQRVQLLDETPAEAQHGAATCARRGASTP